MRFIKILTFLTSVLALQACVSKGSNPDDPYESINRRIYAFNIKFDSICLKPPAKVYAAVVPAIVRSGVNNFYNNINMLPTIANDILQAKGQDVIKDTWRIIINSTFGIGGIFDPASKMSLPSHSNDLGLTFAQWGDKKSPYIMIPFLGPSTIRDGTGLLFEYIYFTPYPYLESSPTIYGLLALRYVDLRSQMFDTERLMAEAIDPYAFMRDAYLQHRNFLINGEKPDTGDLYVDDDASSDKKTILPQEPANGTPSKFPITTAQNVTHRAAST